MEVTKDLHAFLWNSPSQNNCNAYFINGKRKVLVDPGHDHLFGHVEDGLSQLSLTPEDIDVVIITHCHPDHFEGIKRFADTSTMIAVHQTELEFVKEVAPQYGDAAGVSNFEPDIFLQEGDLKIGDITLEVIDTPGHSPGSVSLYWPERRALFTGDVVFYQGVGRTDLPGGSGETLKESIKRISRLDTEYLLSGHGGTVSGSDRVKTNFKEIERLWFSHL